MRTTAIVVATRRLLTLALVFSLLGAPARAQSAALVSQPLQDQARRAALTLAAQESDDYRPGGMRPGYFWSAIGLWSAGAYLVVVGALLDDTEDVLCVDDDFHVDCSDVRTGAIVLGAGLAGLGTLAWILGKRDAAKVGNPSITFAPGGVALRGAYRF